MEYNTCTTDCNEQRHSSTCRSRQRRATQHPDTTSNDATRPDATPDTMQRDDATATDATPSCNADATDHQGPINWADPDKDYSTIARKTDGRITVPGDPGYDGVCKQVNGQWCVPQVSV